MPDRLRRAGWSGISCWSRTTSACGSAKVSASPRTTCGHLAPLANQTLTKEDQQRLANLGKNGPRDISHVKAMTQIVPNERVVLAG